jgi:hypothetical protein
MCDSVTDSEVSVFEVLVQNSLNNEVAKENCLELLINAPIVATPPFQKIRVIRDWKNKNNKKTLNCWQGCKAAGRQDLCIRDRSPWARHWVGEVKYIIFTKVLFAHFFEEIPHIYSSLHSQFIPYKGPALDWHESDLG